MPRHMLGAVLLTSALLAGSAMAQAPSMPQASPGPANFLTDQATGQFRASKLVGVDVYGSEGQKIGDVNEVLMNAQGKAEAIVIGVGGFLGIGEKNVAVPFAALEWVTTRPAGLNTVETGQGRPAKDAADVTASTSAGPERSPAEQAAYNGYPDHAMLRMTKADLQNAPQFKYYADTHARSAAPSNATTMPPVSAPRQ